MRHFLASRPGPGGTSSVIIVFNVLPPSPYTGASLRKPRWRIIPPRSIENLRKRPRAIPRTAEDGGSKHPRDCVCHTAARIAEVDHGLIRPSASDPTTWHPTGRCVYRSFETNILQKFILILESCTGVVGARSSPSPNTSRSGQTRQRPNRR